MDVEVTHRGRITEATLTTAAFPDLTGHGTAFRSKHDVRLDEIGETIAIGRAMQDLGLEIELSGHAQCVTKEEYARVTHLQYRREVAKNPVLNELDKQVRANPTTPDCCAYHRDNGFYVELPQ